MVDDSQFPFVPILSVMPDYGMSPFLWLVDSPDRGGIGGALYDSSGWDEDAPISFGLWQKFADWAIEHERANLFDEDNAKGSDWDSHHARGLQLARWLKQEVGEAYRVVYVKSSDDPGNAIDTRTEILPDGTLLALPPFDLWSVGFESRD